MTVETIEHTEAPTSDISWLKERPEYMPRGNSIVREDGVYAYTHFLKCDFNALLKALGTVCTFKPTMKQLKRIAFGKQTEFVKKHYNCKLQGIIVHPTNTYEKKVN